MLCIITASEQSRADLVMEHSMHMRIVEKENDEPETVVGFIEMFETLRAALGELEHAERLSAATAKYVANLRSHIVGAIESNKEDYETLAKDWYGDEYEQEAAE